MASMRLLLLSSLLVACASLPPQKPVLTTDVVQLCAEKRAGACAVLGEMTEEVRSLSIMQGVTTASTARFAVLVERNASYRYFIRSLQAPKGTFEELKPIREGRSDSAQAIDVLQANNLEPKLYQLVVVDDQARLVDIRTFAPLDLKKQKARVALISCMDDSFEKEQKAIWPEVFAQQPDVLFLIGDTSYADKGLGRLGAPTEKDLWSRYSETRSKLAAFKAPRLVPIIAVWDDHDYGQNDGDRNFSLKDQARKVFDTFFPQSPEGEHFQRGPGVGSHLKAFGLHFVFLDDRTFRSPNGQDIPDQTHFGEEQEKWLAEILEKAKGPAVLISGDQFFGGYHSFESYQGSHPKRFERHLKEWRKSPVPLVFWSGDRHLAEITQVSPQDLGYRTYELTSSGLHAKVYSNTMKRNPNPNQVVGQDGELTYMIIDLTSARPNQVSLNVTSWGLSNKKLFSKQLSVQRGK